MKRFFCTVCKRTKRVRNYPAIIQDEHEKLPTHRLGVCNHHSNPSVYSTTVSHVSHVSTTRKVS